MIQDIISKLIFPLLVGISTYILFRKLDEWKKRRSQSKLGVAILDSLIEEVQTGINIMTISQNQDTRNSNPLPKKSWNGMNTV